MSSYFNGTHYGYDEINVNSSDFTDIVNNFDSNGVTSVKSRELRLQQKLLMKPITDPYDDLKVDHYSTAGIDKTKIRRQIIRDPEDYFVMGQNDYNNKDHKLESYKNLPKKSIKKTIKLLTTKNNKMQEDLEELERQNKMLVFFIFFLIIIVIVQYPKMNNHQPISVMLLDPRNNSPEQRTIPVV
jgi:hypothetical protein